MSLRFENIHHAYGDRIALQDISFTAEAGEILCLLGRSGCGKSTLLNLIAGLLPVQAGAIRLDGSVLASPSVNPPPEQRPVGLVFQDGALFPHLSVAQNIGFGVTDKSIRAEIVSALLDQIGLKDMADRYPHTLSGGEQQRVAVARALAPNPSVMLMDEPFASIDITIRRRLREDMRALMKARGGMTILVTHDPDEAIEIADRIAVLENGRITQIGTAKDLHDAPQSLFVGLMAENGTVLSAKVQEGYAETSFGRIALDSLQLPAAQSFESLASGGWIDILIYPESATLIAAEDGARIADIQVTGRTQIVRLEAQDGTTRLITIRPDATLSLGQRVQVKPAKAPWLAFNR
jgi:iron(III) transport system ATP-binding protein